MSASVRAALLGLEPPTSGADDNVQARALTEDGSGCDTLEAGGEQVGGSEFQDLGR